jgi:16S rRNA processing protein RimM
VTRIVLGRVTGPFGVKGWLKVESFTEPPAQILEFPRWRADAPGRAERELKPAEGRSHGKGFVVRFDGIDDRDAAVALGKPELWVEREELPALKPGEHYRADLVGFEVVNKTGASLGRVARFVDLPANAVMVVVGERERWLPVGPGQLLRVDAVKRCITVDWDAEF